MTRSHNKIQEIAEAIGSDNNDLRRELYHNDWLSLYEIDGYVYSHESRSDGRIVAILPFRDTPDGRQYLLRSEVTPCWDYEEPTISSITGGCEGGDTDDDAVRELYEEAGYIITTDQLIPLGTSYASKSSDTIYILSAVDVTDIKQTEAPGDGSYAESKATTKWYSARELSDILDPQVATMYWRLCVRSDYNDSVGG